MNDHDLPTMSHTDPTGPGCQPNSITPTAPPAGSSELKGTVNGVDPSCPQQEVDFNLSNSPDMSNSTPIGSTEDNPANGGSFDYTGWNPGPGTYYVTASVTVDGNTVTSEPFRVYIPQPEA